ncbi:MAG: hypothetical protein IT317_17230 [Anaerolineales bacterium]|nr:hypothetical protein [Anaerolineales bacterium]
MSVVVPARRGGPAWYLWPFVALWNLVIAVVALTGRLLAVVLGLALLIVGAILTALILTAPLGLPLALFGLLLIVKGLF